MLTFYTFLSNNVQIHRQHKFQSKWPQIHNDTLFDLPNFQYLMNNPYICQRSTGNDSILFIIHSARSHFAERYGIRSTWGSVRSYKGWTLHLAFLLGDEPYSDPPLTDRLTKEFEQHGDMIMGNFIDSYRNLTYKHLMG